MFLLSESETAMSRMEPRIRMYRHRGLKPQIYMDQCKCQGIRIRMDLTKIHERCISPDQHTN